MVNFFMGHGGMGRERTSYFSALKGPFPNIPADPPVCLTDGAAADRGALASIHPASAHSSVLQKVICGALMHDANKKEKTVSDHNNLDIHARLTATDEASPIVRKLLAEVRRLQSLSKSFNSSLIGLGRTGIQSMDGFSRAAQNLAGQMRGAANTSKQASRSFADDWKRAADQRVNDARRMYAQLNRLEADYQHQISRRIASERRAERTGSRGASFGDIGRIRGASVGRLPVPRISTIVVGGGVMGAGVAGALKRRMEVQAAEVRSQMYGDLTPKEVEDLRKSFADRAGLKFGIGTAKALDVATEGLKAGISKRVAGDFGELALKAQAGLDVPVGDVAKLLGRLATQMTWDKGRFSNILNAIAVANNATAADGTEIVSAMRRSLSALATTKLLPEQLAALNSTAISLGIQPHKAGNFLSFLTSQVSGADSSHGQQAKDLNMAANALGFGGRSSMAAAMRNSPVKAITQMLDNLAAMPEKLRTKVAKQIGGREWMDELLTLVLGRDKLRDVLRDVETKQGFLDSTYLKKIKSMQGRWSTISAAFSLGFEKIGAGLDNMFNQISDALIAIGDTFDWDSIKMHVAALVDGLRSGFGLKEWGEAVRALATGFGAGTAEKWRLFGKGFAEGIRSIAGQIASAGKTVMEMFGKNSSDPEAIGKFTGQIVALVGALTLMGPVIGVLSSFVAIVAAVAAIFSGPIGAGLLVGGALGAYLRNKMSKMAEEREQKENPPPGPRRPGESKADHQKRIDNWTLKRIENDKALQQMQGWNMFHPTAFREDVGSKIDNLGAKIERAAFFTGGSIGATGSAVASAFNTGGRLAALGSGSASPTSLFNSSPGRILPNFGVGSGGIIRRDRVPSFSGAGGSMADGLNKAAFERTFAGTPMASKYDQVVAAAMGSGVSPALLAGIMAHETGQGQNLSGNNPGGIMDPSTNWRKKMQFGSLDAGIDKTALTVARNWQRAGGNMDRMAGIYAPQGAANDRGGQNRFWKSGVSKFMGQMADPDPQSSITGLGDPVRTAERFVGKNEWTDTREIANFIRHDPRGNVNAWCARFVNAALSENGIKGTGSAAAASFYRWGSAVEGAVKRGDIMVAPHHVGMATGNVREDGAIQMISGNHGDAVSYSWERPGKYQLRRAIQNVPSAVDATRNVPPPAYQSPGASDARMGVGGQVAIHINGGSHDPQALALLVQRRIDEQMNWRAHDTESEYT